MAVSLSLAGEPDSPSSLILKGDQAAGYPGGFVGRVRERRLLATAIRAISGGGTAGLVVGEPGIGKTALLRAVAADVAAERNGRVLWVRGLESETLLPYAAAADLLTPLRPRFATLPATQRQALEVALALADGPPPNVLATCAGALGVLSAVTDDAPLVVVVDDLQWVDPESAQLLLFAARRLVDERVVMLLAVRSQPGTAPPAPDLPSLRLSGLNLSECLELARSHGLLVSDEVLRPIVAATGGNPLAVLETLAGGLPRRTTDGEQRVAVGGSGQRAWRAILAGLPKATRHALFVTVVSRASGLAELSETLSVLGLTLADLEPARSRDLVQSDEDGVRLQHPLLRRVVLDATPLDVRLNVYRTLADVGPPDLRAWYLSLSTVQSDPDVAARLVTSAAQVRSRRGYSAAVCLSQRAADLTDDPALRAERLLVAATDAQLAGDAAIAAQWARQAEDLRTDGSLSVAASLVRGRALASMGRPADAHDVLVMAGRRAVDAQPDGAAELFAEAVIPASSAGDVAGCLAAAELSDATRPPGAVASLRSRVLVARAHVLAGMPQARFRLAQLEKPTRRADPIADAEALAFLAQSRCWCEDDNGARSVATLAVDGARRAGAPAVLALSLAVRSEIGYWSGGWTAAAADAAESLQWTAEIGHAASTGYGQVALARLEAARGDRDRAEEHIDSSRRDLGPHGIDGLRIYEAAVLGFAALGEGEPEAAVEYLENAWTLARRSGLGHPNVVPFLPDLIEAYLRSGRPERGGEPLAWLAEQSRTTGSRFALAASARCAGLLATDAETAASAFARARKAHGRRSMPLELARTLLCEGEVLRRGRHPAAARPVLREALAGFQALGARPWARRASAELAAAGARPVAAPATPSSLTQLTPQELQIARMVASGRNNLEAAAALYVSRKTVEAHLTRIYRKLAVRSRTELTAVLVRYGILN